MKERPVHSLEELSPLHFTRIGGRRGVRRLAKAFYRRIATEPSAAEVRKMHADLQSAQARLELFLGEWLGGPKTYTKKRGAPRLRARHFSFRIGPAESAAWMGCMQAALAETVQDPELRMELEALFARTAQALINRAESP
jgi:hemoglobin